MRKLVIGTIIVVLLSTPAGCIWIPGKEKHRCYYYYPANGYPGPYHYNLRDGRYSPCPPPDTRPAHERQDKRTEQR